MLKSLDNWTAAGLITGAQKESIIAFEEKHSGNARSRWAFYGFLILGASVIGIGLISLIAANWEKIPGGAKLLMDFALLAAVAAYILALDRRKSDILYDASASLFAFFVLASIGLISQVFHTGGELYQALLFWAVIIFPLSLMTKKGFIPYLWTAGFLGAVIAWWFSKSSWFYESNAGDESILSLALTLPFLALFLGGIMSRADVLKRHGGAFKQWALISLLLMIILTDIHISTDEFRISSKGLLPAAVFVCLAMAALFTEKIVPRKEKIIILMMTLLTAAPYIPLLFQADYEAVRGEHEFFGALYSITMMLLLSVLFIVRDSKRLFNAATLAAGLRFLVVYFQVFKDLAATGFGLIFSGILIIGVAMLWFKQREKLERLFRQVVGDPPHDEHQ